MSRALIVTTDGNPAKFNFWCRNYDRFVAGEVDTVYVTMGAHHCREMRETYRSICRERGFKLICREGVGMSAVGIQLGWALDEVVEDYFVTIEDDLWMTRRDVIGSRFRLIESGKYNMVASPRENVVERKPLENIWDDHHNHTSVEMLRQYHLWNSWLFLKTSDYHKCLNAFLDEMENQAWMGVGHELYALSTCTTNPKHYHNFIPPYRFWLGSYKAGVKLPLIHPDWVFEHDTCDEVFAIGSVLLLKQQGFNNCFFDYQFSMMTSQIDKYFDLQNFNCVDDWGCCVHAGGSSGYDGIYGFVRDENHRPLLGRLSADAFNPHKYPDQGLGGGFRRSMNIAFVKAFNRPELQEFMRDYNHYLSLHCDPNQTQQVEYMANVLLDRLV